MNFQIIEKLGNIKISNEIGNTVAVNQFGDCFILASDGTIQYGNLRQSNGGVEGSNVVKTLRVKTSLPKMSNIISSEDGNLLLIWSKTHVGIIEIPMSCYKDGYLADDGCDGSMCNYIALMSPSDSNVSTYPIVQVRFHSINPHSVVVLQQSECLTVWDLRSIEKQVFKLPTQTQFTSFTFGSNLEWLRFTIFLTTTKREIFAMCPIIPNGTIVEHEIIEECLAWIEEKKENSEISFEQGFIKTYINITKKYLENAFGSSLEDVNMEYQLNSKSGWSSEDNSPNPRFTNHHSDNESILNYPILLQGPLPILRNDNENLSKDVSITDICIPSYRTAAPVLIVSYSNGHVEVLLFDLSDETQWFISPAYRALDMKSNDLRSALPSLLVVDSFDCQNPSNTIKPGNWKLLSDPVHAENFYVYESQSHIANLLQSGWLSHALSTTTSTNQQGNGGDGEHKTAFETTENLENDNFLSQNFPLIDISNNQYAMICGVVIVNDPFLGNIALIHLFNQEIIIINLSVHLKICELQNNLLLNKNFNKNENKILLKKENFLQKQFENILNSENLNYLLSQKLCLKISEGLKNLPKVEITVERGNEKNKTMTIAESKKKLMEITPHIEQNVILPLQELHQHTLFHLSVLQQTINMQLQLINGSENAMKSLETKSSDEISYDLSLGIKPLLTLLTDRQIKLQNRIDAIQEKYSVMKEESNRYLQLALNSSKKLSPTEVKYQQQLEDWLQTASNMNRDIEALNIRAKRATSSLDSFQPRETLTSSSVYSMPSHSMTFASPLQHDEKKSFNMSPLASALPHDVASTPPVYKSSIFSSGGSNVPMRSAANITSGSMTTPWSATKKLVLQPTPFRQTQTLSTSDSKDFMKASEKSFVSPSIERKSQPVAKATLSEEELKACNDLLDSMGDMIQQKKIELLSLEKKVRKMKQKSQQSNISFSS